VYTKFFILYILSSNEFKVSPVVSKKISKKAVIRNKIKRRVRNLVRIFFSKGHFLVIVKEDISTIDFIELENDFKKNINKINKIL